MKQQGSNWEQLLVQFFLLLDLSDWGNSRNLIHLLLCSCLLTSRQLCSLETCFHWKTSNNNNNNNNNAYIAPISILLQSNLAISNSVNSKSPLFRRKIECPWIYPSPLRFPGYFEAPLFRTFFHFPWDFEIAGFDCILYQLLSFLLWRWKIDQMWSDYHFLMFSKMSVQINAKEFSENSWETSGFSTKILHGNLAGSRGYKQYRNQKQRQHKGHETRTR